MVRRLKEKYTVGELVRIAHYHDDACLRERKPFNWDNPLNRKNYSFNRKLAFAYRRMAREKAMEKEGS